MPANGNLPPNTNVNSTTEYFNNYFNDRLTTSPNINDAVIGYFQSVTGDEESGRTLASTIIYTALSQGIDPMSLIDEFKKLKAGRRVEVKTPIPASSVVDTYTTYDQIVADKNEYEVGQLFYVSTTKTFYRSYYAELPTDQLLVVQTSFTNPTFNTNVIDTQRDAILSGMPILEDVVVSETPVYVAEGMPFLAANDAPIGGNVASPIVESVIDPASTGAIEFDIPADISDPDQFIIKSYLDQAIQIQAVANYQRETVSIGGGQFAYNYFFLSYTVEQDEITPFLTVLLNQNRVNTSLLGITNSPPVNKYVQRSILA
jgi:hypothetical protein